MTKKIIVFFIFVLALLMSCNEQNINGKEKCKEINSEAAEHIFHYQMYGDTIYLDSALNAINKSCFDCNDYFFLLVSKKLYILSVKNEYDKALKFIKNQSENFNHMESMPYYEKYCLLRIKSIKLKKERKYDEFINVISEIDKLIRNYFVKHPLETIKFSNLESEEDILNNKMLYPYILYFSNKTILIGKSAAINELRKKGFSENVIEILNEYINEFELEIFNGY